jgi:hypothetical protein
MSDAPQSTSIPEADKKLADQIMMVAAIIAGLYALLSLFGGVGFLGLVVFGAVAAALWFLGVVKIRTGDLQTAKMVAFGATVLIVLFSFGVGSIFGLIGLATGAALIYAAMLLSPGRKLF